MPSIRLQSILETREADLHAAVRSALAKYAPDAHADTGAIAREIVRGLGRRTGTWLRVTAAQVRLADE